MARASKAANKRTKASASSFALEADLCAAFVAAVPDTWATYAETGGWDILLVRKEDGFQIGVQAKLRLNAHVFAQAIEDGTPWSVASPGPDCRAVLVPYGEGGWWYALAGYIGITIIMMRAGIHRSQLFVPDLPAARATYPGDERQWHECCPARRHDLPDYVPDVVPGRPAPLRLTTWKIAAIKIAITAEKRGFVTRADFKHHGIDYRRWIAPGSEWLERVEGGWALSKKFPPFKTQHPKSYQDIARDWEKWKRPDTVGGLFDGVAA